MARIVAFLQNAWSREYAGKHWPRDAWLKALRESRSGQRLRNFARYIPTYDLHYNNTTPCIGDNPNSKLPADPEHMLAVVDTHAPGIVVCFGEQARLAWDEIRSCNKSLRRVATLYLPHPAYRLVTNGLLEQAGLICKHGFTGLIVATQRRGGYCFEQLEK